jgi:hypothetical protein
MYCSSLSSVTLPDSYNEVKECDFHCCTSLSSIVLPSTVTKIGINAFYLCHSLTSITIPSTCKQFGGGCFYDSGITKQNHPELPNICWEVDKRVLN